MAKAHFRFAIGPRARAPGSRIQVGDAVTGTVVVKTPKQHTDIELVWKLGWSAIGRSTNDQTVAQGRVPIARLDPDEPQVFRFDAEIPPGGPVSYSGELLTIDWWLEVSLDIPWAFDPDDSVVFPVYPRREVRVQLVERALEISAQPAAGGSTCPFCKDTVADDRWTCPECRTVHHHECHELYGRCTIPGCSG